MKNAITIFIILLFFVSFSSAQNRTPTLYKGSIDGKMPVTMFIISEDNECTADLHYTAMYKYDKLSNWLQLDVTENHTNQFAMVEYRFTGVLILTKEGKNFNGLWVSPDGKRQFKAVFREVTMTKTEKENYENKMDQLNYENHDC
ncbi:hypothetical protein ASG31_02645 [Chryseobacterium sp. Leaf404]|uniref:hypothetical protein n=1 Tax=unclassified Chryseobacterium TaxID=2593645 RepID=UPI0006F6F60A|nr:MULTISPECIES: hypothetical protein [unclassified Chryseobacterium]KQT22256.1 hypothetical protein ASG31_02645 [Chryseobacterium sp. Leaf404]